MKARYVTRDGLVMRVGSAEWRWSIRNHLSLRGHGRKPKPTGHAKRDKVVAEAMRLVGIHEVPTGSNSGPGVHEIQSATGAYRAAWCVSTVQYIWKKALGTVWADGTAGAYFLEDYARQHHATIPHPVAGCAVVYHIGEGHAGTVVSVLRDGRFWAVEGNWGNAVAHILRDPRSIPCTFVLREELR
jgi:hypothetical protein